MTQFYIPPTLKGGSTRASPRWVVKQPRGVDKGIGLSSPETHKINLSSPIHCKLDSSFPTFKGSTLVLSKPIGSTFILLYNVGSTVVLPPSRD